MPSRLDAVTLAGLPKTIARPAYDRARVSPGIVHLGLGAFARAHLAAYTEDALNAGARNWGIFGVNMNSAVVEDALKPQDGLYTLLTRDPEGSRAQVIGAVVGVRTASRDRDAVLRALVRPETRIVSLTVTEKGYCLDAATGALDERHPLIVADLAAPAEPKSAPGLIVEALRRRRAVGGAPFTVLSLDNLAKNGARTRTAISSFAALRDPELGRFVENEVAFPSTMVDRITPATSPVDGTEVFELLRCEDASPVVAEPFRQWVVEDHFPNGRPAWELGGALMTGDVEPYEMMKLRCLNGAHSTLAYLSVVAGVETISEAMATPGFSELIHRLWLSDMLPTLRPVAGVDLVDYTGALERRFRNPAIRHRTLQISADGSQKLPQRLVGPALERLRSGVTPTVIPLSIAAWMQFLLGRTEGGEVYGITDPLGARLTALAREHEGSAAGMVEALLGIREIFPQECAEHSGFRAAVTRHLRAIKDLGIGAAVATTVGET